MADVQVKFVCGCGFSTVESEEAQDHTNKTTHTLTVSGLVKPEPPYR